MSPQTGLGVWLWVYDHKVHFNYEKNLQNDTPESLHSKIPYFKGNFTHMHCNTINRELEAISGYFVITILAEITPQSRSIPL